MRTSSVCVFLNFDPSDQFYSPVTDCSPFCFLPNLREIGGLYFVYVKLEGKIAMRQKRTHRADLDNDLVPRFTVGLRLPEPRITSVVGQEQTK